MEISLPGNNMLFMNFTDRDENILSGVKYRISVISQRSGRVNKDRLSIAKRYCFVLLPNKPGNNLSADNALLTK